MFVIFACRVTVQHSLHLIADAFPLLQACFSPPYTTCGKIVSLLGICCVSCQACQWDAETLQTTELPIGLLCQCIHPPSTSLSAVLLIYAHYHACETLTVYQDNRVSLASPLGPAHLHLLQLFAKSTCALLRHILMVSTCTCKAKWHVSSLSSPIAYSNMQTSSDVDLIVKLAGVQNLW